MKSEAVRLRIATSTLLETAKLPGDPEPNQTNLLRDLHSDFSEQQQAGQIVANHGDISGLGGGQVASPPHPGKTQGFTAAPDQHLTKQVQQLFLHWLTKQLRTHYLP